jgi:two-component system chemotaxis response regulator CheY
MIVDDSRIVFAQMKKMLEESDIEIAGYCRNGEEALEQYGTINPELVTMDIVMPGMDGLDACRRLTERWPDAKVLIVSSLAYDDTLTTAMNNGAKGFLYKPFTRESLLGGIQKALEPAAVGAQ